jgi:hypothetical protein
MGVQAHNQDDEQVFHDGDQIYVQKETKDDWMLC